MPISLAEWLRLDGVGVDVTRRAEATDAVALEHGDVGVVAVETDGCVGHSPLTVSRLEDDQTEAR